MRLRSASDKNIRSWSTKGSPYPRFQRALKTGNLAVIRNAAAELPRIELDDALSVCMAIRDAEPDRFNRAALRWLARYAVEEARDAADVHRAAAAFTDMPDDPDASLATLRQLVTC